MSGRGLGALIRTADEIDQELTEDAFQSRVIDYAILRGWHVAHHRPARTANGWRTPTQGHVGLPDLVLARRGVVLLAELKSRCGRLTPEQQNWLTELGDHARLWRPADWNTIMKELR